MQRTKFDIDWKYKGFLTRYKFVTKYKFVTVCKLFAIIFGRKARELTSTNR